MTKSHIAIGLAVLLGAVALFVHEQEESTQDSPRNEMSRTSAGEINEAIRIADSDLEAVERTSLPHFKDAPPASRLTDARAVAEDYFSRLSDVQRTAREVRSLRNEDYRRFLADAQLTPEVIVTLDAIFATFENRLNSHVAPPFFPELSEAEQAELQEALARLHDQPDLDAEERQEQEEELLARHAPERVRAGLTLTPEQMEKDLLVLLKAVVGAEHFARLRSRFTGSLAVLVKTGVFRSGSS